MSIWYKEIPLIVALFIKINYVEVSVYWERFNCVLLI